MKVKSILTPSRARPHRLVSFISSVDASTRVKANVEMIFYIDEDDPHLDAYRDLRNRVWDLFPDFLNFKFIFGKPQSVCDSWNDMYEQSMGEIIIMGNDDLIYRTPDWDMKLREVYRKYPDEIYCAWFNDGINQERHCAFPIISKKWVETIGYCFAPRGMFEFGYNDTWVFDLAKRIKRTHYMGDVMAEHNHFSNNKAKYDETYAKQREGTSKYTIDGEKFGKTQNQRLLDANKLKGEMFSNER